MLLSSDSDDDEEAIAGRFRLQQLYREHASEYRKMKEAIQHVVMQYFSHESKFQEICSRLKALEEDLEAVDPGLLEEVTASIQPNDGVGIHDPKFRSTKMLVAISHGEAVGVEIGPVQGRQPKQQQLGWHGPPPNLGFEAG